MLSHAKVDVAPGIAGPRAKGWWQKVALDRREVRPAAACHIRRSSNDGGILFHKIFQNFRDVNASGLVLETLSAHLEALLGRLRRLGLLSLVSQVRQRRQYRLELFVQVGFCGRMPSIRDVLPLEPFFEILHDGRLLLSKGVAVLLTKHLPGITHGVTFFAIFPETLQHWPWHIEFRQDSSFGSGGTLGTSVGCQRIQLCLHQTSHLLFQVATCCP
mmetsp:Transcript_37756/g.87366  ORF Transcript_37756/g.87366 Transcript_37756/m.87366 type:complete len:216 (-) Transcript_37756:937-1584(-)